MRHLSVLYVSIFFACIPAVGVFVADPPRAEAAGGGYAPRCRGGKILLNAAELHTFAMHNTARRNHNLKAFCVHPDLLQAARNHTRDMVRRNYFSHITKGTNQGPCDRIRRQGYRYRYCAENVGYNSTPGRMFKAWMNSSGHRRNILNGKYREIGIGAARKGSSNIVFTVDFGTRF